MAVGNRFPFLGKLLLGVFLLVLIVSGCTQRSAESVGGSPSSDPNLSSDGTTQVQLSITAILPYGNVSVALPSAGHVFLEIQNVAGYHVKTLFDGEYSAGILSVYWDYKNDEGKLVKDGFYNAHVRAGAFEASKKLMILGLE